MLSITELFCFQVSSSSGENVLSPGAKVNRMARFFEDEASKRSESTTPTTRHHPHHQHSLGTPSPLSPTGRSSVGSPDSSLCLSPNSGLASHSSVTSPESDGSSRQMCASVVSHSTTGEVHVTSAAVCPTNSTAAAPPPPAVSSPTSSSVGQRIQDMVQNFQAGLSEKTVATTLPAHTALSLPSSPSHHAPHRPSDFRFSSEKSSIGSVSVRSTICDFRKYEITDLSKLNVSGSPIPSPVAAAATTRRENVMSWPPRKTVPSLSPTPHYPPPVPHADCSGSPTISQGGSWEPAVTSPLHISEDKILDDIPEESDDEWDSLCAVHSAQERQQQQQQQHAGSSNQPQQQRGRESKSASRSCRGSAERSGSWSLRKAKSETNLGEKPRTASLYDEMMSGSWDSGKVLERSASVSEVRASLCSTSLVLSVWLFSVPLPRLFRFCYGCLFLFVSTLKILILDETRVCVCVCVPRK